jgi:hypothetical protein
MGYRFLNSGKFMPAGLLHQSFLETSLLTGSFAYVGFLSVANYLENIVRHVSGAGKTM